MKKLVLFLLAGIFLLSGCAASAPVEFDQTALTAKSEAYTKDMINGDFSSVAAGVAPSMTNQLSADVLKQGWDQTVAQIGTFEQMRGSIVAQNDSSASVEILCDFTTRGISARYIYNAQAEIIGFWITYVPKTITPQSTDSYEEKEVSIGSEQSALPGILTLPKGVSAPPVVLMVHGSGANDLDETIGAAGNKPFADIAHGLAEKGIASLRYNKRTYQYPGEPTDPLDFTIEYEVLDDANAAADFLKESSEVDPQRVYVLGHSLGGMLAPKIAQDNDLAGLISLAGSPRTLEDIMLDQNEALIEASALSGEEKAASLNQAKELIDKARNAKQGDVSAILNATGNYWYTLNQINTPQIVSSLAIPMLFLQGSEDFQVSPERDFGAWKDILSGKENAAFQLYSGLGHLFTPAPETPTNTAADYDAPAAVDPAVIADIASFIQAQ